MWGRRNWLVWSPGDVVDWTRPRTKVSIARANRTTSCRIRRSRFPPGTSSPERSSGQGRAASPPAGAFSAFCRPVFVGGSGFLSSSSWTRFLRRTTSASERTEVATTGNWTRTFSRRRRRVPLPNGASSRWSRARSALRRSSSDSKRRSATIWNSSADSSRARESR
ncbi:MAG: hypothetical protein DYH06_05265, partial [Acidobacteria bacterium ACB2]|nr:hypothetical protein [Acidobacteria bacterium ACB2]